VAEHLKKYPKVAWVKFPGLKDDPQYAKNQKYLKGKAGWSLTTPPRLELPIR
jgi:O-acetylhomoserine (thiol)-lyase